MPSKRAQINCALCGKRMRADDLPELRVAYHHHLRNCSAFATALKKGAVTDREPVIVDLLNKSGLSDLADPPGVNP